MSCVGRAEEISAVSSGRHPEERTPPQCLDKQHSPNAEAEKSRNHCSERVHAGALRGS